MRERPLFKLFFAELPYEQTDEEPDKSGHDPAEIQIEPGEDLSAEGDDAFQTKSGLHIPGKGLDKIKQRGDEGKNGHGNIYAPVMFEKLSA